jgi:hypothetical protein
LTIAGCGSRPSPDVQVIPSVVDDTTNAITPIERGKLRRNALESAEAGVRAWTEGDGPGINEYFSTEYAQLLQEQLNDYKSEYKRRNRLHSNVWMDVTEISRQGDQAIVDYNFTDESYFVGSDGKQMTEPSKKKTMIQLTLRKEQGEWRITQMIGSAEALQ